MLTDKVCVQPSPEVTVTVYVPAINPVACKFVFPFDHINENGPVPPLMLVVMLPSEPPLHVTFVLVVCMAKGSGLLPTTTPQNEEHPLTSVTVMVYVCGHKPEAEAVVCPFDHRYESAVPPVAVTTADPLQVPLQMVLGNDVALQVMVMPPSIIERTLLAVQPLASVTITVYVPVQIPEIVLEVAPLLQL